LCGFSGILVFEGGLHPALPEAALEAVRHRGPDYQETFVSDKMGLAHARLSIIDLSTSANQPFWSEDRRFVMVYNGEIYNFQDIRAELAQKGQVFRTDGDTEVLLKLWIDEREAGLQKLNGFFSLAIYDSETEELFLARDRFGIKPLFYFQDENQFLFSSELSGIMACDFQKRIDGTSLYSYLQLNYLPGDHSIVQGVRKLSPGSCLSIHKGKTTHHQWYPVDNLSINAKYQNTCNIETLKPAARTLKSLLEDSIRLRMIADVPLGGFLSGGLDSSVICALACRQVNDFRTFSIGFSDHPYHDESRYARRVADHIGSNHQEIQVHSDVILESIPGILDHLSEPFADSSALAVYILSREVRKEVKVALSGDGADELFGGYYKHSAEWYCRNRKTMHLLRPLMQISFMLPASRADRFSNINRQIKRLSEGLDMSPGDRYWKWCSISGEEESKVLLRDGIVELKEYRDRKHELTRFASETGQSMNPVLRNDQMMVLPGDMLQKVDLMSMAHALEVRVPFLDHRVVEFVNKLPADFRIKGNKRKIILKELAAEVLPTEIIHRKKHGFEVPVQSWLQGPLAYLLDGELFEKNFIKSQQIFDFQRIQEIRRALTSANPGDSAAKLWALIVFQHWWKKYM